METVSTTTVMIATTSTSGITRTSSPTIATTSTLTLLYHSLFTKSEVLVVWASLTYSREMGENRVRNHLVAFPIPARKTVLQSFSD